MLKKDRICPVCKKPLEDSHGNRRYHDNCAYLLKIERSKMQYQTKSLGLDPFWKNEKILRDFYYRTGTAEGINPQEIEDVGFDFKLYRVKKENNGTVIFVMHQFGFSISKTRKLFIWKIS